MPKPKVIVPEKCRGFKVSPKPKELTEIQTALYAVSLNFGKPDQKDEDDLRFTFERNEDFSAFPTAAVTMMDGDIFALLVACPGMPEFNPMMLLHGEEIVELYKEIPVKGSIGCEMEIADAVDKKKGALVIIDIRLSDEEKSVFAKIQMNVFIRGIGGFGGKPVVALPTAVTIPKEAADVVYTEKTDVNQALIYRLCQDTNPLHIDPSLAALGGFDTPILHGLCFFGFGAKAVYKTYAKGHPEQIKKVSARFTSHVFPGETLVTSMWKKGNTIIIEQKTQERGKVNMIGSVELNPEAKIQVKNTDVLYDFFFFLLRADAGL